MKTTSSTGSVTVMVIVTLFVGLLLGGSVGYLISTNQQAALDQPLTPDNKTSAPATKVAAGETESDRLRVMLADKESAYAKLLEEYEDLKNQPSPRTREASATNTTSRGEGSMTRSRREDPERARQMEQERDQRRQQVAARFQEMQTQLLDRRQRAQSADELAIVDGQIAALAQMQEQMAAWPKVSSLSGSNRMEQVRQLAQDSAATQQSYKDLLAKDRQLRLSQIATQIGYKDAAQAKQFTDAIQKIYDDTNFSWGQMMGSGRGRGQGAGTTTQ